MKRCITLILLLFPTLAWAATTPPAGDVYTARAYVTGTRAETRQDGIIVAFRRVLVKVSGDPALASDPRVDALEPQAAGMVEDLAYQDRMSDEPHHDEQGTRDRPFDLEVHFAPDRIAQALATLGEQPWTGPRPRILARIQINDHGAVFPLTADTESDERQREAIIAAADRFGLRVALAPAEGIGPSLPDHPVILSGTLAWDDQAYGWVGTWHLEGADTPRDWHIEGVSFDEAFRNAMAGAAAALSGHWEAAGPL